MNCGRLNSKFQAVDTTTHTFGNVWLILPVLDEFRALSQEGRRRKMSYRTGSEAEVCHPSLGSRDGAGTARKRVRTRARGAGSTSPVRWRRCLTGKC